MEALEACAHADRPADHEDTPCDQTGDGVARAPELKLLDEDAQVGCQHEKGVQAVPNDDAVQGVNQAHSQASGLN